MVLCVNVMVLAACVQIWRWLIKKRHDTLRLRQPSAELGRLEQVFQQDATDAALNVYGCAWEQKENPFQLIFACFSLFHGWMIDWLDHLCYERQPNTFMVLFVKKLSPLWAMDWQIFAIRKERSVRYVSISTKAVGWCGYQALSEETCLLVCTWEKTSWCIQWRVIIICLSSIHAFVQIRISIPGFRIINTGVTLTSSWYSNVTGIFTKEKLCSVVQQFAHCKVADCLRPINVH